MVAFLFLFVVVDDVLSSLVAVIILVSYHNLLSHFFTQVCEVTGYIRLLLFEELTLCFAKTVCAVQPCTLELKFESDIMLLVRHIAHKASTSCAQLGS